MNKFTVVVPTMWKYQPFTTFLEDLVKFDLVDEVILINNNPPATPVHPVLGHKKIRVMTFGHNIGVNPAWNLGVREARNEKICIVNDDVIFDLRMFYHVDPVLTPLNGITGIGPGSAEYGQPPVTSGSIQVIPWTGQHTFGFGCLMWIHRAAWIPVPNGLDIYYGDNWAFDTQLVRGRTNYIVTDGLFCTPFAATCSQLGNVDQRLEQEGKIFQTAMQQFVDRCARANDPKTFNFVDVIMFA